ncbi:hypothetical protein C7S15_4914 [Burkholderia cepacia]|nr:hypothetical protein [Burkholderia cepacia]
MSGACRGCFKADAGASPPRRDIESASARFCLTVARAGSRYPANTWEG